MLDEARAQFNAALKKGEYVPALINLGNVEYLAGNMKKASELYSRALKSSPNDTIALVGLARATQSDGDVLKFRDTLAKLQTTNPAAAGKYFPSDTVSRASDAENRTVDLWND